MPMFTAPDDVRPEVASFDPYEPGLSIDDIRERYGLSRVVKLASNENPLGVPPKALEVLRDKAHLAFRYPQAGNPRLVKALGAHLGVDPARVVIGNGSDEMIDLIFRVRAVPGEHNAVAFRPCFGLYSTQAKMAGVELRQAPLKADLDFDFDALLKLVDERTTLVLVTSPDNPSGRLARTEDIVRLAKALPPACLLVVDEAYVEFAGEEHSMLRHIGELPNVAVFRTFSKLYGLAGLRIGYAILPPRLADALWRVRLPFSLNTLAEEAALAALADTAHREATLKLVTEGRAFLTERFKALGCEVLPSHANFIMLKPPKPGSKALASFLLERGLIVRTLGGYAMPDWLRVTVGTSEENAWLVRECEDILRGAPGGASGGASL